MLQKIITYQRSVRKRFAKIASIISRPIVNDVGDGNDSTRNFNYIDSLCTFKERRMKDDMETECMNELFGRDERTIVQIYTKTLNNDLSSVLICNDKGSIYFADAMDTPEITVLQRGISYVKNNLHADKTELYVDELDHDEVMKDAYINYCRVNHCIGENPNPDMVKQCVMKLQQEIRWNFTRGGRE